MRHEALALVICNLMRPASSVLMHVCMYRSASVVMCMPKFEPRWHLLGFLPVLAAGGVFKSVGGSCCCHSVFALIVRQAVHTVAQSALVNSYAGGGCGAADHGAMRSDAMIYGPAAGALTSNAPAAFSKVYHLACAGCWLWRFHMLQCCCCDWP
jgi:hypothetical protein